MIKETMLESAIERRNYYQRRMCENMVNVIYFTKLGEEATDNTQEKVDAKKQVGEANRAIESDRKLMTSFDILVEQIENPTDKIISTQAPVEKKTEVTDTVKK
jgi:hypothetical protein